MLDAIAPGAAALASGPQRRAARTAAVDGWVRGLAGPCEALGGCVVAVGGYGRGELAPGSDLDILLLVPDRAAADDVAAAADALWYPMWDAGVRLDHSVRTVDQASRVAREDVRAALGLLDARTVCGDNVLRARLADAVWGDWRRDAGLRVAELREYVEQRRERFGELAHLIEPDLKEAIGGLRDVAILRALAATSLTDAERPGLSEATSLLLDVRDALHAATGRSSDVLVRQEQAATATAIGAADEDDLLRAVYGAARTIAYASDVTWRRIARSDAGRSRRPLLTRAARVDRTPLADGVVVHDGEVVLARNADPGKDPVLVLRAAAAAAQAGLPLAPHTCERLAAESAAMPSPWPLEARDALVSLLGAGRAALPVWEALDQHGVWTRLLPEWAVVRSAPHHSPVHRFAVDRHMVEAAVEAAAFVRDVERPDLLLVSALLHDIGKAQGGDHSEVGADIVAGMASRMGFAPDDAATLVRLVRYHLLLAETATRRDPSDPATVDAVAAAVGDVSTLRLLHALTIADARATGPAASSDWRLGLIDVLAERCAHYWDGQAGALPEEPDLAASAGSGDAITVTMDSAVAPMQLTVAAPDFPGLLAATAGVLALHRVAVRTARTQTVGPRAVSQWGVTPMFGEMPDLALIEQDIRRVAEGRLDLEAALQRREAARADVVPGVVQLLPGAAAQATVIEVRAHDALGLLHRVAGALTQAGCDVTGARITTMGSEALDVFYVVDRATGGPLDARQAESLRSAVSDALGGNFVAETSAR